MTCCVQESGGGNGLEAGNMLWLIQRDFLQGKTVNAMVADALAQQPNPHGDRDIEQVLHDGGSIVSHRMQLQRHGECNWQRLQAVLHYKGL